MNEALLREADRVLSKCGRPSVRGAVAVPLFRGFLMPMVIQPNQTKVFTKEVTGDVSWWLRDISSAIGATGDATGVRIQIQLPNGRFLVGQNGQDVGQFAWVGSWRYNMDLGIECEPGSKIQVTLSDVVGLSDPLAVNLLFGGCYVYYLKGDSGLSAGDLASKLPRYQGIVNENILAPCWVAGEGPATPEGFIDERFTYTSMDPSTDDGRTPVDVGGSNLTATLKISIDAGYDFFCRRILLDVTRDVTATAGTFLGRLRTGSGYALMDSFLDIARYLNGAEYPHDWKVRGEDAVYADLNLVDVAGSGNYYAQLHLEGVRRRRK